MLYDRSAPAPPRPMHYLRQAAMLHQCHHRQGMPLAELSRMMGLTVAQVRARMSLASLDGPLQARLMAENAPEAIAMALLRLPDEVTRHRLARRILRERLCIRDAALLVDAALRRLPPASAHRGRVVNLVRDHRPYINAIRSIAGQMRDAGVRVTLTEQRQGGALSVTLAVPLRHPRMARYQGM